MPTTVLRRRDGRADAPVGRQINEVVLDNDSAGVTFTGTGPTASAHSITTKTTARSADAFPTSLPAPPPARRRRRQLTRPTSHRPAFIRFTHGCCGARSKSSRPTASITPAAPPRSASTTARSAPAGYTLARIISTPAARRQAKARSDHQQGAGNRQGRHRRRHPLRQRHGRLDRHANGRHRHFGLAARRRKLFHWIARSVGVGTSWPRQPGRRADNNVSAPSNIAQYMFPALSARPSTSASIPTAWRDLHSRARRPRPDRQRRRRRRTGRHEADLADHPGATRSIRTCRTSTEFRIQLDHRHHVTRHERSIRRDQSGLLGRNGRHDHRGGVPRQLAG